MMRRFNQIEEAGPWQLLDKHESLMLLQLWQLEKACSKSDWPLDRFYQTVFTPLRRWKEQE